MATVLICGLSDDTKALSEQLFAKNHRIIPVADAREAIDTLVLQPSLDAIIMTNELSVEQCAEYMKVYTDYGQDVAQFMIDLIRKMKIQVPIYVLHCGELSEKLKDEKEYKLTYYQQPTHVESVIQDVEKQIKKNSKRFSLFRNREKRQLKKFGVQSVLIVHPSEDVAELMKMVLELEGYDVFYESSATQAVELLSRGRPGMVIHNVMTDGMSCHDFDSCIRELYTREELEIVIASAHAVEDDYLKEFDIAAAIVSPFEPARFGEIIDELMINRGKGSGNVVSYSHPVTKSIKTIFSKLN